MGLPNVTVSKEAKEYLLRKGGVATIDIEIQQSCGG